MCSFLLSYLILKSLNLFHIFQCTNVINCNQDASVENWFYVYKLRLNLSLTFQPQVKQTDAGGTKHPVLHTLAIIVSKMTRTFKILS